MHRIAVQKAGSTDAGCRGKGMRDSCSPGGAECAGELRMTLGAQDKCSALIFCCLLSVWFLEPCKIILLCVGLSPVQCIPHAFTMSASASAVSQPAERVPCISTDSMASACVADCDFAPKLF